MEPVNHQIQLRITIERIKILNREQRPAALHLCCQPFGVAARQGRACASRWTPLGRILGEAFCDQALNQAAQFQHTLMEVGKIRADGLELGRDRIWAWQRIQT